MNMATTPKTTTPAPEEATTDAPAPSKAPKAKKAEDKQPEVAETIEEQGIGAQDPYPTGNPPVPEDSEKDVPNTGVQPVKKG
jgi:hypothetical protein